jgi:hypothetical protein
VFCIRPRAPSPDKEVRDKDVFFEFEERDETRSARMPHLGFQGPHQSEWIYRAPYKWILSLYQFRY